MAFRQVFFATALVLTPVNIAVAADHAAFAGELRQSAARAFDAEKLAVLSEAATAFPDAASLEGFGHAFLMQRHFDEATFFFASAVERDAERASALTALGVVALEAALAGTSSHYYDAIVSLQRDAAAALPDEGLVLLNLGTALLRAGQAVSDYALISEAVFVLEQAFSKEFMTEYASLRLAEARAALGDASGAAEALGGAFVRNPHSPGVSHARVGTLADVSVSGGSQCDFVRYYCEMMCPGGIIGQINRVTCEMSQAGAQSDCLAGKPYARNYDCSVEMPEFGIMIPGLYPGLSIVTPWGSIDVLVEGNGRVDFKAKALSPALGGRFQGFLDVTGNYDPRREQALLWDVGSGMQLAIFNSSPAIRTVNDYDVGPSAVVRFDYENMAVESRLEAGRGVLLSQ